ncbi:nucleotidyltransferase [Marinicauda salina]|uniref:Nucleotidyltransferase n=1 Tax=Marinicauda salina TaxID=2135793 RepID=A0A2U2BVR9_9PROT|nr:DNA polymerase Y family protein [Marinicauda salina]PWE18090.1 nucleotidyltransferase [Marinicauda salina]
MRFAALSLPRWPTDRLIARAAAPADDADAPFVLTLAGAGGERLHALTPAAEAAGLTRGMGVADARALAPKLRARPADPDADRAALVRLARWCGRVSPWTAADPGDPGLDGVLLDITGCAGVFGGEDRLLEQLVTETRALGLEASAAAAPTIGLAWALARIEAPASQTGWTAADDVHGVLEALPVEALRIGTTAARLKRFGLKRVGDLLTRPRADLAKRFGTELLRRLDQAAGVERESLDPLQPAASLRARARFAEARTTLDGIKAGAETAIERLCRDLAAEGLGARRVRMTLYRVDGAARDLVVGAAAPSRDAAHLARLVNERLDRAEIDIGFGVDLIEAAAALAEPLRAVQSDLAGEAAAGTDLARLIDRLSARLGETAVLRATAEDSHVPERAGRWTRASGNPAPSWPERPERRPLLVLERPEPAEAVAEIPDGPPRRFTWRRVRHHVARAEGPERIAPEWWRAPPGSGSGRTRDYFRLETDEGRRFWLFRDGLYGRETDRPRWFVHGAG